MTKIPLWLIPTLVFSVLVVLGALAHPLWDDEAETALFARNVNSYGVPRGWDGVNLMGTIDAVVLDKNLTNHTSPWVQYYLVALSFQLFGESSFSARLPMVLVSVISFVLIYFLALKLTKDKLVALLTLIILSICVPFILFSYSARYYPLTVLAGVVFLYSALSLKEKSIKFKLLFILSGVFFAYSHYLSFLIFFLSGFLSLGVYYLIIDRKKEAFSFVIWYLSLGLLSWGLFLPWIFALKPTSHRTVIEFFNLLSFYEIKRRLFYIGSIYDALKEIFPLSLLPLLGWVFYQQKRGRQDTRILFKLTLISGIYLLTTSLLQVVITTKEVSLADSRYHIAFFPLIIILLAYLLRYILSKSKLAFYLILVIYLFTNLFFFTSPQGLIWDYLKEVIYPYPTPNIMVASFLKTQAKDGDTAFVSLDRDHDPLIFFLGKKLKFVNRVTPYNPRIFPEAKKFLPTYIYYFTGKPDWIILFGKRGKDGSFFTYDYRDRFPKGLVPEINFKKDYQETVLPVFFSDLSRPEIGLRTFSQVKPEYEDQVFIYHRVK